MKIMFARAFPSTTTTTPTLYLCSTDPPPPHSTHPNVGQIFDSGEALFVNLDRVTAQGHTIEGERHKVGAVACCWFLVFAGQGTLVLAGSLAIRPDLKGLSQMLRI